VNLTTQDKKNLGVSNTVDYETALASEIVLDCLARLCEVVRVEMTGTRVPESRRLQARIQRKHEIFPNVSEKMESRDKD
jgi:hypothetical protein